MLRNAGRAALLTVLAVFSLTACATVPTPVHEDPLRLLLSPERVLVSCNLQHSRTVPELIFTRFMEPKDADRFLDRTNQLHILLTSPEGGEALGSGAERFTLLGKGSYPRRLTNFAFGGEEQWERRDDPLPWWEHRSGTLQVAVLPKGYIVISNGGIRETFDKLFGGKPKRLPSSVEAKMRDAAVTLYAPRMEGLLRQVVAGAGAGSRIDFEAVRALEVALYPDDGEFTARGEFVLTEQEKARAFALVFRLLLITSARNEGPEQVRRIIQQTKIESSERRVKFQELPVTYQQIETLLHSAEPLPVPVKEDTVTRKEDK